MALMFPALDLVVLVELSGTDDGAYGYDLLRRLRSAHGIPVATTSLYRALRQLLDRSLIAEVAPVDGEDPRRRRYRLTDAGLAAVQAERRRLTALFASSPRVVGGLS